MAFSLEDNVQAPTTFDGTDFEGAWWVCLANAAYYVLAPSLAEAQAGDCDVCVQVDAYTVDTYFTLVP